MDIGRNKEIRLQLLDGDSAGIVIAEIEGWVGSIVTAPRNRLHELLTLENCRKTSAYFIVGKRREPFFYPNIYFGDSFDVAKCLNQYNKPIDESGKDWDLVYIITAKENHFAKKHYSYLVERLIEIAQEFDHCQVMNEFNEEREARLHQLNEADKVRVDEFIENLLCVLPALGCNIIQPIDQSITIDSLVDKASASSKFYEIYTDGALALGLDFRGRFMVIKGSKVNRVVSPQSLEKWYLRDLRPNLLETGIIDPEEYQFTRNYVFDNPSIAASVICGAIIDGREKWRCCDTEKSYGSLQIDQLRDTLDRLMDMQ